jgi:hypothetical protein
MSGVHPSHRDSSSAQSRRSRWRTRAPRIAPGFDQEDEVREKLYAKPALTDRTVEVLGPVERMADRPAA